MLKEFKEFIARGTAIDLAVGVVIGAAFSAIVKNFVDGLIMPVVGFILGKVDFSNLFVVLRSGKPEGPYTTLKAAQDAGAVILSYGLFVNTIVSFLLISFVIFLLLKGINKLRKPQEASAFPMKDCPFCLTSIREAATRCPACTSELPKSHA